MDRLKRLRQLYWMGLPRPGIPALEEKRAQILAEIGIGKRYYLLAVPKVALSLAAMALTILLLLNLHDSRHVPYKYSNDPIVMVLVLATAMTVMAVANYVGSYFCARITLKWQEANPRLAPPEEGHQGSKPGPIEPG